MIDGQLEGAGGEILELHRYGADDPLDSTRAVCDWFEHVADMLRPLAIEISLNAWDPRDDDQQLALEQPYWSLYAAGAERAFRAPPTSGVVREVATITAGVLHAFLDEALAATRAAGVVSWSLIEVTATEVRLPASAGAMDAIVLQDRGHRCIIPVRIDEAGRWVGGPSSAVEFAPFTVRVQNHYGSLHLRLQRHWSLWALSTFTDSSQARGWQSWTRS